MIGQQVSHYEILSRLGAGGMGEVFEAREHRLGRRVALKFLPQELSRDARAVERLQRKARIASSLNHPHICTIHDIDSHHGTHFIVMELLNGLSLRHRIQVGTIAIREVIEIALQVAEAIAGATCTSRRRARGLPWRAARRRRRTRCSTARPRTNRGTPN